MKALTDFVWDADRSVTLTVHSDAKEKRPVMLVLPVVEPLNWRECVHGILPSSLRSAHSARRRGSG